MLGLRNLFVDVYIFGFDIPKVVTVPTRSSILISLRFDTMLEHVDVIPALRTNRHTPMVTFRRSMFLEGAFHNTVDMCLLSLVKASVWHDRPSVRSCSHVRAMSIVQGLSV